MDFLQEMESALDKLENTWINRWAVVCLAQAEQRFNKSIEIKVALDDPNQE